MQLKCLKILTTTENHKFRCKSLKKKTCLFELLFYNRHRPCTYAVIYIYFNVSKVWSQPWYCKCTYRTCELCNSMIRYRTKPSGGFFFVWVWVFFFFNFCVCVYVKSNILEQKIKGIEKQNTRTTDINTDQENTYKKILLKTKFLN